VKNVIFHKWTASDQNHKGIIPSSFTQKYVCPGDVIQ